ncbi:MAG: hypothetical protein GF355_11335 [Candidatus Eisenbacteria bacterium]|nr:hypothetical protein [Candidatus Eisenbacteria bacterium]
MSGNIRGRRSILPSLRASEDRPGFSMPPCVSRTSFPPTLPSRLRRAEPNSLFHTSRPPCYHSPGEIQRLKRRRCEMFRTCLVAAFVLLLIPELAGARTWEVYPDGSGDVPTIQAAIDASAPDDSIAAHAGTYYESISIVQKNGIHLMCPESIAQAVLDPDGYNRCATCIESFCSFNGFTFINGSHIHGGGIYVENSDVSAEQCILKDCYAAGTPPGGGGAIYLLNSDLLLCHSELTACACDYKGGAIYAHTSSLDLRFATLSENQGSDGGAIYTIDTNITLTSSLFQSNQADYGAAIYHQSHQLLVNDCLFASNQAAHGAGIYVGTSDPWQISGSTFVDNQASRSGAALTVTGYDPPDHCLVNSIVAYNRSPVSVCDLADANDPASCCLFWNPVQSDLPLELVGTNGNISLDPLFCDLENSDFRLHADSPCAPGNHPDDYDCGLIGAYDVGCGTSGIPRTVEAVTWGTLKNRYR